MNPADYVEAKYVASLSPKAEEEEGAAESSEEEEQSEKTEALEKVGDEADEEDDCDQNCTDDDATESHVMPELRNSLKPANVQTGENGAEYIEPRYKDELPTGGVVLEDA